MSFEARTNHAAAMEAPLDAIVWKEASQKGLAGIVNTGYEHRYTQTEQTLMKPILTGAVRFVRYVPDRLVIRCDGGQPPRRPGTWFLEYKVMLSPIQQDFQLEKIRNAAKNHGAPIGLVESLQKADIGTVETAAWGVYKSLQDEGAPVAIAAYCSYPEPRLVCEYVDQILLLYGVESVAHGLGSNTPYTNLDLRTFRSMSQFMHEEIGGQTDWQAVCQKALDLISAGMT
ncbi:hypothetical protein LLF88_07320 [bacterium]|nr:hypothetical protein [bacterium]